MLRRVLFAALILLTIFVAYILFRPYTRNEQSVRIRLKDPTDLKELEATLQQEKIILNTFWLRVYAKFSGAGQIPVGSYAIAPGESLIQLGRRLWSGRQTPIKLILGNERIRLRTTAQFASKVQRYEYTLADSAAWMNFLASDDSLHSFGVNKETAITRLLPLTYEIYWTETPRAVYASLNRAWERFWDSTRKAKANRIGLTPTEVHILASIVEEETQHEPDRPLIASTYLNRLRIGMRLQADPTAKFGSGDFAAKQVTQVHLRHPSPYNTYLIMGLPPGPICLPSIASIDAVLNAPKTEYLYFVASHTFDGTSVFSKDYDQHIKKARLYQEELKKRLNNKPSTAP